MTRNLNSGSGGRKVYDKGQRLKGLTIAISLAVTYSMVLVTWLPYRFVGDELPKRIDIVRILEQGQLVNSVYSPGYFYQMYTGVILAVVDGDQATLQYLSPLIAAIGLGIVASVMYRLTVGWNPNGGHYLLPVVGMFTFAGFVNRFRESSHKGYIYILLFVLFLLVIRTYFDRRDSRIEFLIIATLFTITMFNYIWGGVFSLMTGLLLASRQPRQAVRTVTVTGASVAFIHMVSSLPFIRFHRARIQELIIMLLTFDFESQQSVTGAVGKVEAYPTVELLGVSVTSWTLFSLGIVLVAVLTAVANAGYVVSVVRGGRRSPFGDVVVKLSLYFGGWISLFILSNDVATVKRVAVYPGVFALVFIARSTPEDWPVSIGRERLDSMISVLLVLLLLTAALGVGRTVTNGNAPPFESRVDTYLTENELASAEFVGRHDSRQQGCTVVPQPRLAETTRLSKRTPVVVAVGSLIGETRVRAGPLGNKHVIYDSGTDGEIYCGR